MSKNTENDYVRRLERYATTSYYSEKNAIDEAKQLMSMASLAAIREVAENGVEASERSKYIAAKAFARISFGKNIPFGILLLKQRTNPSHKNLNKNEKTHVKIKIVSDPAYEHERKTFSSEMSQLYESKKDDKTKLPVIRKQPKYFGTTFYRENTNWRVTEPIKDLNGFVDILTRLQTGTTFIHGHSKHGNIFYINHLRTENFARKKSP